MKKDNFWKIYWSVVGVFVLVGISSVGWLQFSYLNAPEDRNLALAVGVNFDPSRDPFAQIKQGKKFTLVSGYFYQESIPFGFEDWSWDTETAWRQNENVAEGSYALKVKFLKPWSGIRLNSQVVNAEEYKSITLSVNPDGNLKDLFIELHDKYGNPMKRQSVGWYTASSTLNANVWNIVSIPLENLISLSDANKEITGFSISSEEEGTAFIDSIRLEKTEIAHAKWEEPTPSKWLGQDPYTGIAQENLPYSLEVNSENFNSWRKLFGQFEKVDGGVNVGPIPKKTNGGIAVFGGGKDWTNYRADAVVYWGMTSTFSILARFENDANFVACAYSNYGSVVQIYAVKNGESTMMGQTPGLAIKDYEPWKNAKHGMEVRDNKVSCYMDGEKVISANIPNMSAKGSVGFETWSKNSEDYPHKIISLTVKPL